MHTTQHARACLVTLMLLTATHVYAEDLQPPKVIQVEAVPGEREHFTLTVEVPYTHMDQVPAECKGANAWLIYQFELGERPPDTRSLFQDRIRVLGYPEDPDKTLDKVMEFSLHGSHLTPYIAEGRYTMRAYSLTDSYDNVSCSTDATEFAFEVVAEPSPPTHSSIAECLRDGGVSTPATQRTWDAAIGQCGDAPDIFAAFLADYLTREIAASPSCGAAGLNAAGFNALSPTGALLVVGCLGVLRVIVAKYAVVEAGCREARVPKTEGATPTNIEDPDWFQNKVGEYQDAACESHNPSPFSLMAAQETMSWGFQIQSSHPEVIDVTTDGDDLTFAFGDAGFVALAYTFYGDGPPVTAVIPIEYVPSTPVPALPLVAAGLLAGVLLAVTRSLRPRTSHAV